MKMKRVVLSLCLVFLVGVFVIFPTTSFAADEDTMPPISVTIPPITDDYISLMNTPPKGQISTDPNYSEGFSMTRTSVAGSCSITKLSSSSVNTSGYTNCAPASPSVEIILMLQSYYSGSWHTLQSRQRAVSGSYVSLSQSYSVTPGYYYRSYAIHQTADGATTYSYTNGIWVG